MFIAKEGFPFIVTPLVLGVVFLFFGRVWAFSSAGAVLIFAGLFCGYFFRDPARNIPKEENLVLSPCDGTVLEVSDENNRKTVRVFLSILNVHLQRAPVSGRIRNVEYRPGKFLPAMKKEAHQVNEQNVITIETKNGDFVVKQIAGILARRVVSWVKPGDIVASGQKIGLIKFGSQVDLELPPNVEIKVKPGDKVAAGETIFGEYKS